MVECFMMLKWWRLRCDDFVAVGNNQLSAMENVMSSDGNRPNEDQGGSWLHAQFFST